MAGREGKREREEMGRREMGGKEEGRMERRKGREKRKMKINEKNIYIKKLKKRSQINI